MRSLSIDQVRTFVCVAETASFTAAGALVGATQSAISVRIRKLEAAVGVPLLHRTPRDVALTADGVSFLREARRLLDVHDEIVRRTSAVEPVRRLAVGISDHVAGTALPSMLQALNHALPRLRMQVEVAPSEALSTRFSDGEFDAALLRNPPEHLAPRPLFQERLVWFAANGFHLPEREPLPLVVLSRDCRIREASVDALDRAGHAWQEALVGGSVATVRAAVTLGLGIACLGRQNAPDGSRDVGAELALPDVPPGMLGLVVRRGRVASHVAEALATAFRANQPAAGTDTSSADA
ncbi:MAG: LysR family transcriptional regulator [Rhodospirillaceae bacterium]|nr:LysR family transcriptional regulator [Rhodospirillaceae bacterium]